MAIFEVQGPDGKIYEVEAPTAEAAAEAIGSFGAMPAGGSSVNKEGARDFKNRALTFAANAAQGAGFGFGDEAVGLKAGVQALASGGEYLPAYRAARDDARADMATVNEAFPNMAAGGQLTGMAIPALTAAPLATGSTMLGTAARSGGLGMAEGGLQGAGYADGRDVIGQMIKGALIGGGAGIAAPALVGAAGAVKNALKDPVTGVIDSMIGRANVGKANRAIAGAVGRTGKTPADLDAMIAAARTAGQPEFRLVDALGLPGQRTASGIARAGGAPGDEVAEFLATRQAGQGERVGAFVEDAFDVKGTTAAKTRDALNTARKETNTTNYNAARQGAGPVNLTETIETIDGLTGRNPIIGESALSDTEIGKRLTGLRGQIANSNSQLIDFDQVLNVKEDLGKVIGRIKKSGEEVPFELAQVYGALDRALEASSDGYRAANSAALAGRKVVGAVDEGAMMATRGRAADNVPRFGAMAAEEQRAARVGYGDRLLDQLERITAPTTNRAKPLQSPKRVAEADAMTTDPRLYADRLARENTMWETQNRALGGSRTADNLADQEAVEGLAGGLMGAARSAGNFQIGDAVARVAAALGPLAKGQNEATRMLIAQALLSGNPAATLAPVMAQAGKSATVRRLLEAMIRQPMREGGEALVQ